VWLAEAIEDIARLHHFLEANNPEAAVRAAHVILNGAEQLVAVPEIGKPMADGTARRELVLAFGGGAYVLRYILEHPAKAVIIRVWHSREDRL